MRRLKEVLNFPLSLRKWDPLGGCTSCSHPLGPHRAGTTSLQELHPLEPL